MLSSKEYKIDKNNFDKEYNAIYNKSIKYAKKNKLILIKINTNKEHTRVFVEFDNYN